MILYHGEPNGPSLSVLAALEESGLAIECRAINLAAGDRHRLSGVTRSETLDYAVEGEGPVLVVGGEAMTEAVFIAQYLDEASDGGLQPADPYARWQMLMWCRQATERLAPAAAYIGLQTAKPGAASIGDIRSDDLRQRWQDWQAGRFDESKLADSRAKVAQFAQRIEDQLADGREWLMGDFSIADLETFAWLRSMRTLEAGAFSGKERCEDWLDRVESRPSVQKALARSVSGTPERSFAPGPEINRWG
jgi:GST-like protein